MPKDVFRQPDHDDPARELLEDRLKANPPGLSRSLAIRPTFRVGLRALMAY